MQHLTYSTQTFFIKLLLLLLKTTKQVNFIKGRLGLESHFFQIYKRPDVSLSVFSCSSQLANFTIYSTQILKFD